MGRAVPHDLARNEDVQSTGVYDIDSTLASEIAARYGSAATVSGQLDAADVGQVTELLRNYDCAVSCVTYRHNPGLTQAAIAAACHLVDLGGNNDTVKTQLAMHDMAREAGVSIVPDCGLAPGMVSVLTADGISRLDHVTSVKIRVGGLPQSPKPPLSYQLVFSAEGLINEYTEPCVILENGRKKTVNPMTGIEELSFDGIGEFEAFYTSGGASTLPDTYAGRVVHLDYKTIRYPGHCARFRAMLDIGLASRQPVSVADQTVKPREVFKAVLEKALRSYSPDMVLVRVIFEGHKDNRDKKVVYEIVDRQDSRTGLTAMMRTTAFPAAIIAWMAASNQLSGPGCVPQELAVKPSLFIPQLKKRGIYLTVVEPS
jgi:lysine 6-dehydrogenase